MQEVAREMSSAVLLIALLGAALSSCAADEAPGAYPNDAVLRLNHIQLMGSHNSYHKHPASEPMATVVREQYSVVEALANYRHEPLDVQLDQLGVRHLELDVNADPQGGNFAERPLLASIGADTASGIPELDLPGIKVFHIPQVDAESSCYLFTDCLQTIEDWSDAHPGHAPIMIMLEIKDRDFFSTGTYLPIEEWNQADYQRLDDEIRSVFDPDQLVTPDDVRGSHATLRDAILTDGWPTLAETRGKLIFTMCNCFSDTHRIDYEGGTDSLEGKVVFPNSDPNNPDAAFVLLDNPSSDFEQIQALVRQGYIVRTRSDANLVEAQANDATRRDRAFASGAHFVSTDYPEPDDVLGSDFFVQVPGGKPAGCNPVSAPGWCTAEDIEDPDRPGVSR